MGLRFNAFRVDIVFDTYPVISINAFEYAHRLGHNIQKVSSPLRRIISSKQQLPKQWKEFLRHNPNKKELSVYLYRELLTGVNFFLIYSLRMELLVMLRYCSGRPVQVPELHCDHAEADTRLFLNSMHAAEKYLNIFLSSADSDVFVIGLFLAQKLPATIYLEYGKYNTKLLGIHKSFFLLPTVVTNLMKSNVLNSARMGCWRKNFPTFSNCIDN